MSVDGVWFRGYLLPKHRNALIELSLLHELCSLNNGWIRCPTDLIFYDCVCTVLQPGVLDDYGSQNSEDEPADMRPMGHSRRLTKQTTVGYFHEQPHRKQPVGRGFKANPENQHVPKHVYLQFWEAHQKTAHERSYCTRGPESRSEACGVKHSVDKRRSDSG